VSNHADFAPFHVFDTDLLPVTPWRNGGGETREVAAEPSADGGFAWRVSIATIAQDGPFSAFPGVDRTITLLEGAGVHLVGDGLDHLLDRIGEPFAFPGDLAIDATLLGGVNRDLNIMTRRGEWAASVRTTTAPVVPTPGHAGLLYVLRGRWECGRALEPGRGAWWAADAVVTSALTPLTDDALAVRADIHPV
jgi:environmental stress-induced protein Ves